MAWIEFIEKWVIYEGFGIGLPMDERSPTMSLRAGWMGLQRISEQGDGSGGGRKIDLADVSRSV